MNIVPRWNIYGRSQARFLRYPNSRVGYHLQKSYRGIPRYSAAYRGTYHGIPQQYQTNCNCETVSSNGHTFDWYAHIWWSMNLNHLNHLWWCCFFSEILVTLKNIYLYKHFSSGDIQNIAHEGPKCQQFPALRYFSNVILIANFVTAYLFISNTFIKYTFIKYQYLFNDNKKNICNTKCWMHYHIFHLEHLVPKTPRLNIFKLNSMASN